MSDYYAPAEAVLPLFVAVSCLEKPATITVGRGMP
jgi:hypothetical protein